MRKIHWLLVLLVVISLSACTASRPPIGTGQQFTGLIENLEKDRSALVYIYRKDGWGYERKWGHVPIVVSVDQQNGPNIPVVGLLSNMYRAYLFAPGKTVFKAPLTSHELDLVAGKTYCMETGWRYRFLDVITLNETPLEECMESMKGLEQVKKLNDIRLQNSQAPLQQIGFKDTP